MSKRVSNSKLPDRARSRKTWLRHRSKRRSRVPKGHEEYTDYLVTRYDWPWYKRVWYWLKSLITKKIKKGNASHEQEA
jgi:hypothetical protein